MTNDDVKLVDVELLRIGQFIELDVGWMSHPFPTGSFKLGVSGLLCVKRIEC